MTFGVKTNERPGTRAQVKFARFSAYKARAVLDLIRGESIERAQEILQFSERDAAAVIDKCVRSAVANAEHNDSLDPEELYVSACYADEGPTLKRWRPRARGRATRIRKRTCHITVIVSRYSDEELAEIRRREESAGARTRGGRSRDAAAARRRRVARSRGEEEPKAEEPAEATEEEVEETETPEPLEAEATEAEKTSDDEGTSHEEADEEEKPAAKKAPAKKKKPAAKKVVAKKSTTGKKAAPKKAAKKTTKKSKKKAEEDS
jgi:large subunit ribosomal protein L22